MQSTAVVLTLAALAAVPLAGAQTPFGLHAGMTATELRAQFHATPLKNDPLSFTTKQVPTPNSEFESYTLVTSPTYGLCKVIAVGVTHSADAYGTELQGIFGSLVETLSGKYGKHRDFDFLNAGSIWSEPGEWMMSLNQKERTLSTFWAASEGSNLPTGLHSIALEAHGLSRTDGYLTLGYEFNNLDPCYAERAKLQNASF